MRGWKRNNAGMQNLSRSQIKKLIFRHCTLENEDLLTLEGLKSLKDLVLEKVSHLSPQAISRFRTMRRDVAGREETVDDVAKRELLEVPLTRH
jgi:hypothetical protein